MKKIILRGMRLENYKSFSSALPGRRGFSCEFGARTKVSGRNREGKSTIRDAWFDILTGKMADGSQPDSIRPHDENGAEINKIDVIREVEIEVDGEPVTIEKRTAQKWRKSRGQSDEAFCGNETTYIVDGFEKKAKEFQRWQECIADPDVLLMCSNAKPFLNLMQKSTAEARGMLERMSGFSLEEFIGGNPEYTEIQKITRGNSVEDSLKKLRRNLREQEKEVESIRTKLEYEKGRNSDPVDAEAVSREIAELKAELEYVEAEEEEVNKIVAAYDERSDRILSLKFQQSDLAFKANEGLRGKRKSLEDEILKSEESKRVLERELESASNKAKWEEQELKRISDELQTTREDWKKTINEEFDRNLLVCPTCGRELPEEQADRISADFEERKSKRIAEITERGNMLAESMKKERAEKNRAEEKCSELKKKIEELSEQISKKSEEHNRLPEAEDLSGNEEYQAVTRQIAEEEKALKSLGSLSERRMEIGKKKDVLTRAIFEKRAQVKTVEMEQESKKRRVEFLTGALKEEAQRCADIEKKIDLLTDFSIQKNRALSETINSHFHHFQFAFSDVTQDGSKFETLKIVCGGTTYFGGLNGGDQRLVEIDLCRGLQEMNGLCLPIWVDEANTIDEERIPVNLAQQLILIERENCDLAVEILR